MKYTSNLNAEQIGTLKQHKCLKDVRVTDERGFTETADLVIMSDNKPHIRQYPKAHFRSVVVVDDNALVLTRSEADKMQNLIAENGEYVIYDKFKQFTDDDKRNASVKAWLDKLEAKKQGKLDISTNELTRQFNEWRASNGYCRATSLVINEEGNICEAVTPSYSNEPVSVYKIAEEEVF